jgi:hypothetical protein
MNIRNLLLSTLSLTGNRAWASDLFVALDANTLDVSPGQTITFSGIIMYNDQMVLELNNIDVTLGGVFSLDISPFLLGPPT